MRKPFILMIFIIFCLCVTYVKADIHEVWPDPNGNSLKEKIKDDAVKNGDIIIAHPGEYEYNGFKFYGKAITVMSEDPNDPNIVSKTVITGESERRAIAFVDNEGNHSVLKGFTIHNGKGIHGGGIYCSGSSPTIKKCTIEQNNSENHGGGIKCFLL